MPKQWAMDDTYCQLIPNEDEECDVYEMLPRIGAFEVTYKGVLVYSKLLSKMWPNVLAVAQHIINMLKDSHSGASVIKLRQKYQTTGAGQKREPQRGSTARLHASPSTKSMSMRGTANASALSQITIAPVVSLDQWQPRPDALKNDVWMPEDDKFAMQLMQKLD